MSNIYIKGDYEGATSSMSNLSNIASDLKNYSKSINNYISEAESKLQSNVFKIMFKRLRMYADSFEYLGKSIEIVGSNSIRSNRAVSGAMEGYSILSYERKEELERELQQAKIMSSLNYIEYKIKMNSTKKLGQKFLQGVISSYTANANAAVQAAQKELDKYCRALENTELIDKNRSSQINSDIKSINSIKNAFIN